MKRKMPKILTGENNIKERRIILKKYGTDITEQFNILKTEGAGSSCVCYKATLSSENKIGRLKEFYPLSLAGGFTRHSDNSLDYTATDFAELKKEKDLFLKSYNKLREIFKKGQGDSDIESFIPDFTIYESCDKKGNVPENSTLYIWTENKKIKLFSDYIKKLHSNYEEFPEHKLFTLLSTLITLSKRIGTLHEEGFLHLDIKPSNFGVQKFKNDVLTDNIYLFDINTIYSVYEDSFVTTLGSEGYSAPEVRMQSQRINNRSDVYSLGCLLFAALTGKAEGFCDEEYSEIGRLVKESKLITATDSTCNIYLVEALCNILKNALKKNIVERDYSCEDIVADLEKARRFLVAAEYNEPINLESASEKLDKKPVKAEILFLNHLYKHPLYECMDKNSNELNVLLAGFGNHSQRFLDCCLQLGQMYNKKLRVTVATRDAQNEKDLYLKNRPALKDFFSVDGDDVEDSYGNLVFKDIEFSVDGDNNDDAILESLELKPHYVFVSLGKDNVNSHVAQSFDAVKFDVNPNGYSVNYVLENAIDKKVDSANAIILSNPIARKELTELNRMGLNAHLVWVQDSNYDLKKVKNKFKDPDNYTSSIANVVSSKYKLKSIGIDCNDLNKAADMFNEQVLLNEDKTIFNELVAVEHRRWVAEKICKGWTRQDDLQFCLQGSIKDEKNKKHVCLVPSNPGRPDGIVFDKKFFDAPSVKQFNRLDALDQLSINLHKTFKDAANTAKKNDFNLENYKSQLKNIIAGKNEIDYAFFDWCHCLTALWNEEKSAVFKYKGLKEKLEASLKSEDENGNFLIKKAEQKMASEIIKNIDSIYYPIIESLRYDDYKKKDEDLVKYIPFILTYKHNLDIVVPLKLSDNYNDTAKTIHFRDVFMNVAAITIVNPSKVCYVCPIYENKDIEKAQVIIKKMVDYLIAEDYKTKLSVIVQWNDKRTKNPILFAKIMALKNTLLTYPMITAVEIAKESSSQETKQAICKLSKVDAIQKLYGSIDWSDIFNTDTKKLPYFSLDSSFELDANSSCNYLNYTKCNKSLTVSDIFKISNARGRNTEFPEFFDDYMDIFNIYSQDRGLWKSFCGVVKTKSEYIVEFGKKKIETNRAQKHFYAPAFAFETLKKIEQFLKRNGVIDDNSFVYHQHTDRCVIELNCVSDECIKGFEKLLSNLYKLCDPNGVRCYKKGNTYCLDISNLVCNITMNCFKGKYKDHAKAQDTAKDKEPDKKIYKEDIKKLLELLENQHLITNVKWNGDYFSFCFTSQKSRELLTKEGAVLEMYVYISCLKSGLFDDVATGYEINREGNEHNKNELDVVLTSGFKSAFIECKATNLLDENFYQKLNTHIIEFGLNSKGILVADKYQNDKDKPKYSDEIINYGKQMQILTVFDDESLENIAQTLYDIINN